MFKHDQHSFFENVLNAERIRFHRNIAEAFTSTQNTDCFYMGNVVYRLPFKRTSITTLLSDFNTICHVPASNVNNRDATYFLKTVSKKFLNIQAEASFAECMQIIHPYQINAGKHFYGALLRSTSNPDIIINPFHVLTAIEVLSSEYMNHEFNVLLYFHPNRDTADNMYNTSIADKNKIDINLNMLMQSSTSKLATELKLDVVHKHPDNIDKVTVVTRSRKYDDEAPDSTHFIVAHQLLTKGIIAPYYGASLIRWDDRKDKMKCKGIPLTPFGSVNLKDIGRITTTNAVNTQEVSVCTGNIQSNTLKGLRTLTHSNLSSAYVTSVIRPGLLAYADAMVEKSTSLYINAGVITPYIKKDPMKDFTEEEFACTTYLAFLTLRKKTPGKIFSLMDIKAQFNAMQQLRNTQLVENPPVPPEKVLALIHRDGTTTKLNDRIVYINKKSGRRISALFVAVEEDTLITREISSNRLIKHNLANVKLHESIISNGVRVFVSDYVNCVHRTLNDTEFIVKHIQYTEPQAFNSGDWHLQDLSHITIRNL